MLPLTEAGESAQVRTHSTARTLPSSTPPGRCSSERWTNQSRQFECAPFAQKAIDRIIELRAQRREHFAQARAGRTVPLSQQTLVEFAIFFEQQRRKDRLGSRRQVSRKPFEHVGAAQTGLRPIADARVQIETGRVIDHARIGVGQRKQRKRTQPAPLPVARRPAQPVQARV